MSTQDDFENKLKLFEESFGLSREGAEKLANSISVTYTQLKTRPEFLKRISKQQRVDWKEHPELLIYKSKTMAGLLSEHTEIEPKIKEEAERIITSRERGLNLLESKTTQTPTALKASQDKILEKNKEDLFKRALRQYHEHNLDCIQ